MRSLETRVDRGSRASLLIVAGTCLLPVTLLVVQVSSVSIRQSRVIGRVNCVKRAAAYVCLNVIGSAGAFVAWSSAASGSAGLFQHLLHGFAIKDARFGAAAPRKARMQSGYP